VPFDEDDPEINHISARFYAPNHLPLLKQFFEFGQASPRL
jgi:hypothetical protein